MKILGIIPCRAGSKRLPGKNLLRLGGKTLWAHAVEQAIDAGLQPVVSTDIQEIFENEPLAYWRREDLCQDDTPIEAVVLDVLERHPGYDGFVLLNPTHPFRAVDDIRLSVLALKSFPSCTGVRKDFGYTIDEGARYPTLNEQSRIPRLIVTGAIYAVRTAAFLELRKLMIAGNVNRGTYHIEQGPYLDINTHDDYHAAKGIWEARAKDPLRKVFA